MRTRHSDTSRSDTTRTKASSATPPGHEPGRPPTPAHGSGLPRFLRSEPAQDAGQVHRIAEQGVSGSAEALPHLDAIQPAAAGMPPYLAGVLQAKLMLGAANDPFEREADAVADRVMRMADDGGSVSPKAAGIQRKCAACDEEDEGPVVRAKAPSASSETSGEAAPPSVMSALRSPAQTLDSSTRAFFEPRFGRDLSGVRVHTGAIAAESARDVRALAYTVGRDVVFGAGQFAPSTDPGRRLLAHELTHTLQQAPDAGTSSTMRESNLVVQRGGLTEPSTKPSSCSGWDCSKTCKKTDSGAEPEKTASTSWKLTLLLDLDVASAAGVLTPGDVGHSYVQFTESNGDTYTYGFYHNKTTLPIPDWRPSVPGCVAHPDDKHRGCVDMEIAYAVTQDQYNAALKLAQAWCETPLNYHILTQNCVTFVSKVAERAGITLPNYTSNVTPESYVADNPYALFESFVSPSKTKRWRNMLSGVSWKGQFDSNGMATRFKSFEIIVDEKLAVGADYSFEGSSGDIVKGHVDGRLVFQVAGASKAETPVIFFKWTEPSSSGRGVWNVSASGNLKGTWGRGSASHGAGGWEVGPPQRPVIEPEPSPLGGSITGGPGQQVWHPPGTGTKGGVPIDW